MSEELPDGWARTTVEQVGSVALGRQRSPKDHTGPHMRPYVRAANVTWSGWDLSDVKTMNFDPAEYERFRLERGDILLNEGSGSAKEVGKAAIWNGEVDGCCFQNTLLRFRTAGPEPEFMRLYFTHAARSGKFVPETQGVNIFHIGRQNLAAFPVPLPPLAEQRRIVAKVDALAARSARARADLDRIPVLVERFKQAVLERAFEPVSDPDRLIPFADQLAVLTSGSRDWARFYDRGSSVFVLAGNIRPLAFDPTPKRFVDPPLDGADAARSRIEKDDLLLTIVGAGTGDICVVPDDLENYFVCQSVALLRLKQPSLSRFYQYWFVSEANGRKDFNEAMYGAARPHLSFEQLRAFQVPRVSETEAEAIVARIEAAFARIDRIAAEAARARGLVDRLDAGVLDKAFRGALVPQDPADEPASALLERIRGEREAAPKARRGRRR